MAVNKLKDKVSDELLDLSVCNYSDKDVPVREIAALRRINTLDLSNNRLTGLPMPFASLIHLVKIDLSCNQIIKLPSNFGQLTRLRHLDLYNNQIEHLPLSFDQLRSLHWLDLKKNPLSEQLQLAAGSCLNQRECEQCARHVVAFMARVRQRCDAEKEQQRLQAEQARQKQIESEEQQREAARAAKKARKDRLKQDIQSASVAAAAGAGAAGDSQYSHLDGVARATTGDLPVAAATASASLASGGTRKMAGCRLLLVLTAVLLASAIGMAYYCSTRSDQCGPQLQLLGTTLQQLGGSALQFTEQLLRNTAHLGARLGDQLVTAAEHTATVLARTTRKLQLAHVLQLLGHQLLAAGQLVWLGGVHVARLAMAGWPHAQLLAAAAFDYVQQLQLSSAAVLAAQLAQQLQLLLTQLVTSTWQLFNNLLASAVQGQAAA